MPRPAFLANVTNRDTSQCSNFTSQILSTNFQLEIKDNVIDHPAWNYIFWVTPLYQVRSDNFVL